MLNLFKKLKGDRKLSKEEKEVVTDVIDKVGFIVELGKTCCSNMEKCCDPDALAVMQRQNDFMERRIKEMQKRLA